MSKTFMFYVFKFAAWLPEWVYGRELLAKMALTYLFINSLPRVDEDLEA